MTEPILIYTIVSLVLGGIAATITIWIGPDVLPRANGRGTFLSPKVSAIGVGLFVTVLWPVLLIGACL